MTLKAGLNGAPFGSNVDRFPRGVHSSTNEKLGPGCYDVDFGDFSSKAVKRRASGPGWARAYETSHMTVLPYLLNREEWERNMELPRKLGPGTYNHMDSVSQDKKYSRGILAMKEPRFKEQKAMVVPGPGTYGEGGIPQAASERKARQSFGTVALLDCGGNGLRTLPAVGSSLGPGTYTIPSALDEFVNKRTGTLGPYEVFTVDRSKPIVTGHYASSVTYNLGPGQYQLTSSIDEMKQKKLGEFGKAPQYPRQPVDRIIVSTLALKSREPTEPGPGQYDPKDPYAKPLSQAVKSPPFMSSCQRADKMATKFFTGNHNSVGPGRYDIQKRESAHDITGCQSVFKSKTDRPSGLRLRVLSERLAPKTSSFLSDDRLLALNGETNCYRRASAVA